VPLAIRASGTGKVTGRIASRLRRSSRKVHHSSIRGVPNVIEMSLVEISAPSPIHFKRPTGLTTAHDPAPLLPSIVARVGHGGGPWRTHRICQFKGSDSVISISNRVPTQVPGSLCRCRESAKLAPRHSPTAVVVSRRGFATLGEVAAHVRRRIAEKSWAPRVEHVPLVAAPVVESGPE
jgi:hypothetical protein